MAAESAADLPEEVRSWIEKERPAARVRSWNDVARELIELAT